jgi:hypothetical protein
LGDLRLQPLESAATPGQFDHVRGLGPNMIELQYNESRIAAVDASGLG